MTFEPIEDRLSAVPFLSLELCLADGRALRVDHSDLLGFAGGKRLLTLWSADSAVEVIDVMLILSLRFSEPHFVHAARPSGPPTTGDFT